MIECARLKSGTWQDHGRIAAHLSKQARYDDQAAYPLVVFVDGRRPTLLRLIGPPAALGFVRDSNLPISPIIAKHIYSQGHPPFLASNLSRGKLSLLCWIY